MKIVLYRILGNDLPPRHRIGQTLEGLRFILEHEPEFPGLEKRWLLNRIFDPAAEQALAVAIGTKSHRVDRLPFDAGRYRRCWPDFGSIPVERLPRGKLFASGTIVDRLRILDYARRAKNLYLMNNNGARNAALDLGFEDAQWVLPWDGGCFLTEAGWREIRAAIDRPDAPACVVVPMSRVPSNDRLLDPRFEPGAFVEPQLAFSRDARARFDGTLRYGSMPKAQLLRRLRVPGPWNDWVGVLPWERVDETPAADECRWVQAGWVARLAGDALEAGLSQRGADDRSRGPATEDGLWRARFEGVLAFTTDADRRLDADALRQGGPTCWRALRADDWRSAIPRALADAVRRAAEQASRMTPPSVIDKPAPAPGATHHDYFSVAPFLHGSRLLDGVRRADMVLYSDESERYDRSRFQRMVDACCALALDHSINGRSESGALAAAFVRTWFLDPVRRMNPDVRHAQRDPSSSESSGGPRVWSGIVEFRDLPPLLDAIRILVDSGALTAEDDLALRDWFGRFLLWLVRSGEGRTVLTAVNNLSTWHCLVVASLAAHLRHVRWLTEMLDSLPFRMVQQFDPDGRQPHEACRAQPIHYALFNLQAWANLATLCASVGRDLWAFVDSDGRGLIPALECARRSVAALGPGTERDRFSQRIAILDAMRGASGADETIPDLVHPDAGVPHFWRLTLPPGRPDPAATRPCP